MRTEFLTRLHAAMLMDKSLMLLTADIGYGVTDRIRADFPDQHIDFGAAEQLMIGAAAGLALSGKKPVCYSITPFLLYRPFEWIRNFLNNDKIPVKLVGVGRDRDYLGLGSTHWAEEDGDVLAQLPGIHCSFPDEITDQVFASWLNRKEPSYINLTK